MTVDINFVVMAVQGKIRSFGEDWTLYDANRAWAVLSDMAYSQPELAVSEWFRNGGEDQGGSFIRAWNKSKKDWINMHRTSEPQKRDATSSLPRATIPQMKSVIKTQSGSFLGADGVYDFNGLKAAVIAYLDGFNRPGFDFWKLEQLIKEFVASQGATYRMPNRSSRLGSSSDERAIQDYVDWYLRAVWNNDSEDPLPTSVIAYMKDRKPSSMWGMFSDSELVALAAEVINNGNYPRTVGSRGINPSARGDALRQDVLRYCQSGEDGYIRPGMALNDIFRYLTGGSMYGWLDAKQRFQIQLGIQDYLGTTGRTVEHVPASLSRRWLGKGN